MKISIHSGKNQLGNSWFEDDFKVIYLNDESTQWKMVTEFSYFLLFEEKFSTLEISFISAIQDELNESFVESWHKMVLPFGISVGNFTIHFSSMLYLNSDGTTRRCWNIIWRKNGCVLYNVKDENYQLILANFIKFRVIHSILIPK